MNIINKFNEIVKDSRKIDFYVRWLFRIIMLSCIIYLTFIKEVKTETVFTQKHKYADSLVVERYKVKFLEETLKNKYIKNEEDSINIRNYNLDSLISYIANDMATNPN